MTEQDDILGPVNYLVVEFPDMAQSAEGFATLLDTVRSGAIAVLDLEFFAVSETGTPEPLVPSEIGARVGVDLRDFDGANSSLLDAQDRALAASNASPGSTIAALVWEDLTLVPVIAAWQASGSTVLAEGPVLTDNLLAAIEDDPTDPDDRA